MLTALPALVPACTPAIAGDAWNQRLWPTWQLLFEPDPRVLYSVATSETAVALTIDDAPDPDTTPAILEVLARHGANATFFVTAERVAGREELVRDIVRGGHELGHHMLRDRPSIDLGPGEFEQAFVAAHRALAPFARPRWFRPASGWYNSAMLYIVESHGYRTALGNVFPGDTALPFTPFLSRFILWRTEPGAIIILHDGHDRGRRTAATLSDVLPALEERGLNVLTLSELVDRATSATIPDP